MIGYLDDPLVKKFGLHDVFLVVAVSILEDGDDVIIKSFCLWISEEGIDQQHKRTVSS